MCTCVPSRVQFFVTPWTVSHQVSLFMDFPGKITGVGSHFFLQRIFLTQGSNLHLLCLLHCRQILYHLSCQGSPFTSHVKNVIPPIHFLSSPIMLPSRMSGSQHLAGASQLVSVPPVSTPLVDLQTTHPPNFPKRQMLSFHSFCG